MSPPNPMARTVYPHIVTFGTSGEPFVENHRIRVRDIVLARDAAGRTPEEIAGSVYPSLTLGEVYAALAYYEDHREEIDRAGQAEAALINDLLTRNPQWLINTRPDA